MINQYFGDKYGGKKPFLRCAFAELQAMFGDYNQYSSVVKEGVERVVFVCQGNICRSALAEEVFKTECNFPVASFGLATHTGKQANSRMVKAANGKGYDLTVHVTTAIEDFEIKPTDLLICMQPNHIEKLHALNIKNTTVLLGCLLAPKKPILIDPYSAPDAYVEISANNVIKATLQLTKSFK